MTEGPAAAGKPSRTRPHLGLSGKLLVLTLLFVMIAEVLIYVPSVANFRDYHEQQREDEELAG